MKNSPLTKFLLVVLTASALASVALCWMYMSNTRQLRAMKDQFERINYNRAVISALANEAVEYSKKNPAIDPILESVGAKPAKTGAAPAATKK